MGGSRGLGTILSFWHSKYTWFAGCTVRRRQQQQQQQQQRRRRRKQQQQRLRQQEQQHDDDEHHHQVDINDEDKNNNDNDNFTTTMATTTTTTGCYCDDENIGRLLQPHENEIFHIKPVTPDLPQYIGSDVHFTCGYEVESRTYENDIITSTAKVNNENGSPRVIGRIIAIVVIILHADDDSNNNHQSTTTRTTTTTTTNDGTIIIEY